MRKTLIAAGILACLAVGARLRLGPPAGGPPWTQDEWCYAHRAGLIARDGAASAFPRLVAEYNSAPAWWQGPSPLRAGYLLLLAGRMRPMAEREVTAENLAAGARFSALVSLLALGLLASLAWKVLGPEAALLGTVLMITSPLDLLIARRCWQDGLFAGSVLLLAAAVLARERRPSARAAVAVLLAALWACLVKESALAAAALLGSWALAARRGPRTPLLLGAGVLAAALVTSLLAGGAGPAWEAFRHAGEEFASLEPMETIPRVLPEGTASLDGLPMISDPNSRMRPPAYGVLVGLWALSPATLVLGLLGVGMALGPCLGSRARLAEAPVCLAWLLSGFLILGTLHPNSLRLMMPADLLLHLMAGWAAWGMLKGLSRPAWALGLTATALACWGDWSNFRALVARGTADPGIPAVVARTIYPLL